MAPPPQIEVPNYSTDYLGSFDEWVEQAARSLAEQYVNGVRVFDNFNGPTGAIGQPAGSDFNSGQGGSRTGTITPQTLNFFRSYVRANAHSDPWLASQFGTPPSRQATFQPSPSSPGAVAAGNNASNERIAAGNNATTIQAATIAANASIANAQTAAATAREGFANDWRIAQLRVATDRYIAEGGWGVQRYVAELSEKGAMERLKLELGMREKELAQRAVEERNRNQNENNRLALEIAKYDAELAASPRNWLKYAAWLSSRNIVVNGLSLAMAAQEVPESQISPATVANVAGPVAGLQTAQESQQQALGTVTGQSGGGTGGGYPVPNISPTSLPKTESGPGGSIGTYQPPPSGANLDKMSAVDLANKLLGMSPGAATPADASQGNLQGIMDSVAPGVNGRTAGFGAYGGPTRNALGVDVGPGVSGAQVDYRQFAKKLPTEQGMFLGGIESVRGASGVTDWTAELERSRPKGRATGAASYG